MSLDKFNFLAHAFVFGFFGSYLWQQCFARLPLPHEQGALRLILGTRGDKTNGLDQSISSG
jgi:hypothetical protein